LVDIFKQRAERVGFIQGDDAVDYQYIAEVISIARSSGVDRIGLLPRGTADSLKAQGEASWPLFCASLISELACLRAAASTVVSAATLRRIGTNAGRSRRARRSALAFIASNCGPIALRL
jgi:hypothetical protein